MTTVARATLQGLADLNEEGRTLLDDTMLDIATQVVDQAERIAQALALMEELHSSYENMLAHFQAQMPAADQRSRQELALRAECAMNVLR